MANKKFRLGLTMAGAVSAGAYTGGVLDYFIQTLDAWYEARATNDPSVPQHEISLDIISGASAGGITGGMATLALQMENRFSITPAHRTDEEYKKKNIFYNSWVNMVQDDMLPELLNGSDIQENKKLVSVLNSQFIEDIARRTIVCLPACATAPPPYVHHKMQLVLTLSNLNGFEYKLNFSAQGASLYSMTQYRDYAFFKLTNTYEGDGRIPLNPQKDIGLEELKQAATATGAFPIGLAYRKFVRKKKYILDNEDLVYYVNGVTEITGIEESKREEDYVTYNIDGGMLNNEPFDLTLKLMTKASEDNEVVKAGELKSEEEEFDSTIIMIDPFPSDDSTSIVPAEKLSQKQMTLQQKGTKIDFKNFPFSLLQVISRIYHSMRGELLFKGEDIVKVFSKENFSRFMIAPSRRTKANIKGVQKEVELNGSVAIACGALDGFAGFLDKRFREHDYFLGRVNCQSFLRNYFRIQLKNGQPINSLFAQGYPAAAIERFKFQDEAEKISMGPDAPWYVPIIPDVHIHDNNFDEKEMDYPVYRMEQLDEHKEALLNRIKLIAKNTINSTILSLLFSIWFSLSKNSVYKRLRKIIEKQFTEWRLVNYNL